jgi:hypothetical protein
MEIKNGITQAHRAELQAFKSRNCRSGDSSGLNEREKDRASLLDRLQILSVDWKTHNHNAMIEYWKLDEVSIKHKLLKPFKKLYQTLTNISVKVKDEHGDFESAFERFLFTQGPLKNIAYNTNQTKVRYTREQACCDNSRKKTDYATNGDHKYYPDAIIVDDNFRKLYIEVKACCNGFDDYGLKYKNLHDQGYRVFIILAQHDLEIPNPHTYPFYAYTHEEFFNRHCIPFIHVDRLEQYQQMKGAEITDADLFTLYNYIKSRQLKDKKDKENKTNSDRQVAIDIFHELYNL